MKNNDDDEEEEDEEDEDEQMNESDESGTSMETDSDEGMIFYSKYSDFQIIHI